MLDIHSHRKVDLQSWSSLTPRQHYYSQLGPTAKQIGVSALGILLQPYEVYELSISTLPVYYKSILGGKSTAKLLQA